jgi:predicted MPP superfamily phosphohydrolase
MKRFSNSFIIPLLVIFFVFVYNEYLVYFHVMFKCNWPLSTNGHHNSNNVHQFLNVMLISDTHLLGSRNGHWFDKLRREWQQHRAFQTARTYLRPDYIVILGDLTDEGKWCSDQEVNFENKA